MLIHKEDLYQLVNLLDEQDHKIAFDFLEFLVQRSRSKPESWERIEMAETDHEPLPEQE